ncbi:IS66 family transposase [Acanthopleuribacter pedis]|uniref:IS66 family transposase n=1 Tax=Acanthopleuribacter pedis TaxID=442870 RepID=A0A8J7QJD7_9BACT|nr:IS66 family transposase [Acanthopleuribacter pedis]MBO1323505.1 IS66 family transposase [Acanthopleuribacter pedis]
MSQTQKNEPRVAELELENELLREKIRFLEGKLYHRSSEARKAPGPEEQDSLFDLEEEEKPDDESEPEQEKVTYTRRKRGKRQPIPDHFERVEILHDLSDEEKVCACGTTRKRIGEETSEQLDLIPAKVQVLRHIRPKYVCPCCESSEETETPVAIAPSPKSMIPKSLAGPGLLAHLINAKYTDALPFYRQEKQLARLGVRLSRTTMSEWSQKAASRCRELVDLIQDDLLASNYVQIDETRVRVHGEQDRKNTTNSYMWVMRGGLPNEGPRTYLYNYSPTRAGETAKRLLSGYQGLVHTDGYSGYDFLGRTEGVVHLACWVHARRKFDETIKANKKGSKKTSHAQRVLSLIAKIYKGHKAMAEHGLTGEKRLDYRREKIDPQLKKLKDLLETLLPKTPPESKLGKAVRYMSNRWRQLVACFEYSEVRLDTNLVENAIRPFVIGRKNWLHCGSPEGAAANGIWFSIIETAKANGQCR